MRILLRGGLLVDPRSGTVRQEDLVVSGGRIAELAAETDTVIDAEGCVVMPGNVCAHHHLYSALARGMPPPERSPGNFLEILELIWWRLDRALDLETIELSALFGAVVATRAGTTCIVDHHASPNTIDSSLDAVAGGLDRAGMRGVVSYEVTDRHGEARGKDGVEENLRFHRDNSRPLLKGMMGAHASFTIGPSTLEMLVGAARDVAAPIHIHVAEDGFDQRDSVERYGTRVVPRLAAAGALEEGDLIAHGIHLDTDEIELLVRKETWIAHNPRSNMNNGVGRAPAEQMGPRVALGTDGIDGDLFAEAKAAHLSAHHAGAALPPDWVLRRLAAGGALAAEMFAEPLLGTLDPGAPADLIVLDRPSPTPIDPGNLSGHLLFGWDASAVRDVFVGGRPVVLDRRHQLVDEAELADRCRAAARRLWEQMSEL
jgi:putative selenium metabolism protein SsnA